MFIFGRLIWVAHSVDGFFANVKDVGISGAGKYFFLVDRLVFDIFMVRKFVHSGDYKNAVTIKI